MFLSLSLKDQRAGHPTNPGHAHAFIETLQRSPGFQARKGEFGAYSVRAAGFFAQAPARSSSNRFSGGISKSSEAKVPRPFG